MVGSGSSVRVGYENWSGLLRRLEDVACRCGNGFPKDDEKRENDPLGYASRIKTHIEQTGSIDRYHAKLCCLFQSRNPQYDDFHKTLISLPFRGILTTNYDPVLEAALCASGTEFGHDASLVVGTSSPTLVRDFLLKMNNDQRFHPRIAHLHGRFDFPEDIILGIDDYSNAYGFELQVEDSDRRQEVNWPLRRKFLWSIFATRRVVFVGFGMKDPYLNRMLEFVSSDLHGFGQSTHYVITSISQGDADESKSKASYLRDSCGVGTVFYESFFGSHRGLEHIVDEIANACGLDIQSTSVFTDSLEWLQRTNERMLRRIDNEN